MQERRLPHKLETLLSLTLIISIAIQLVLSSLIYREIRALRAEDVSAVRKASSAGLAVGSIAPAFTLSDTQGVSVALADFEGKRILAIFSSPDCPYCQNLYEDLRNYDESYRSAEAVILMLSLAPIEVNRQLQEQEQFEFPVLTATRDLFLQYEIPGTPFIYVIDSRGEIQARGVVNSLSDILTLTGE